jgi:protein gp37
MAQDSKIQWTDHTWNIATGCTKVDEDCKFCYMYRQSLNSTRFNPMEVKRTKTVFNLPLKIKEPSKIFTCSFTDFFHKDCDSFRNDAWDIIRKCPQHTFQILTKRPERISECLPDFWDEINERVWLGTSIGSNNGIHRLSELVYPKRAMALPKHFFLSLEPLHGEVNLPQQELSMISWVIIGGESGNDTGKYRYRPCNLDWIRNIANDCKEMNVNVFIKQMGTYLAKELKMNDRHGGDINEFPTDLQIRQFPK